MSRAQIDQTAQGRHSSLAYKQERRAKRKAFASTLKVGDILVYSWGYEQTNIDYFEVVAVHGPRAITIRPIGQRTVESERGSDRVAPAPGHYTGPPERKIVGEGNSVRMENGWAHLWDGKPDYQTATGWGH